MNRLAYAFPAWACFATKDKLHWLQSVLKKARRWGLDGGYALPTLQEIHSAANDKLFRSIIRNPDHVLHNLAEAKATQQTVRSSQYRHG